MTQAKFKSEFRDRYPEDDKRLNHRWLNQQYQLWLAGNRFEVIDQCLEILGYDFNAHVGSSIK